jgi:hypothetical protein
VLISFIGLFFGYYAVYVLIVPVLLTAGISVVYSYYIYVQIERGSDTDSTNSL